MRESTRPFPATLENIARERTAIARDRDNLVAAASSLGDELRRILDLFTRMIDPVSRSAYVKIDDVPNVPCGIRISLYNGHFLQFEVTNIGKLRISSSTMQRDEFADDIRPGPNTRELQIWKTSSDGTEEGIPVSSWIDRFVADAVRQPDL